MHTDIIIPIYNNYFLVDKQVEMWSKIKGNWILNFCDNTNGGKKHDFSKYSKEIQDKIKWFTNNSAGIDGERHGGVIDFMINQTTSDIIGIMDSDFIWFDENLLKRIQNYFEQGYQCVGTELYYRGFEYVNKMYPERAGWLTPCVFGMFIDRKLCTETFVCTRSEGYVQKRETGWRIRKKLIDDRIKTIVFKSFQYDNKECGNSWFYKDINDDTVMGVHLLQGSGNNNGANAITMLDNLYEIYIYCNNK